MDVCVNGKDAGNGLTGGVQRTGRFGELGRQKAKHRERARVETGRFDWPDGVGLGYACWRNSDKDRIRNGARG